MDDAALIDFWLESHRFSFFAMYFLSFS